MTKWKIGLVVMGLASIVACGDSASDDTTGGDTAGGATAGGATAGGATAGGATAGGATAGGETAGGATAGGETAGGDTAGGETAGGATAGGATAGGVTAGGDEDGGTTGPTGTGACLNDADQAIINGSDVESLACEGAACAGLHLMDAPGQTTCISTDAPTLKQLSAGCQKCFDDITTCVPAKCVALLGGEDGCGISLPNTDFAKCENPAASDAKCMACNAKNCQPAFMACSGLM